MSNSTLVSAFGQSDKMGLLCFDIVDLVTYGQSSHWVKKLSLKNVGSKCVMCYEKVSSEKKQGQRDSPTF